MQQQPAPPPGAAGAAAGDPAGSDHHHQQQQQHAGNVDKWWLSESSEDGEDAPLSQPQPDPFYDPEADDEDEKWVQQQRKHSDAVLSCPSCFTTVCIDCQQHEVYHTQYRAMLTLNCDVKLSEVIRSKQVQGQQRRGKRKASSQQQPNAAAGADDAADAAAAEEVLHPVCCAVCGTQVGARDAHEVIHFFHVLASET